MTAPPTVSLSRTAAGSEVPSAAERARPRWRDEDPAVLTAAG